MKKFYFLLRFLIISLVYCLYKYYLEGVCSFVFGYQFFIPILSVYLIVILISFKVSEQIELKIKIITDSFFICIIILQVFTYLFFSPSIVLKPDISNFYLYVMIELLLLIPFIIPFIIWTYLDVRKLQLSKETEDSGKKSIAKRKYLFRFIILTLLCCPLSFAEEILDLIVIFKPVFFYPTLIIYFLLTITCLFVSIRSTLIIQIIAESIFVLVFTIQTIYLCILGSIDYKMAGGDSGLVPFLIFSYLPMFVFSIVWLVRDVKLLKKNSMEEID